ncbi:cysteine hydrolase family protein [Dokdonella sp.]|uniref:cysteine hydrolase family protein n=1 Tax=Dokdonella sp. TaxID=2291710 RepID=UPI001B07F2B4|nr:cysteine hydrolase family protein [Dokdonella sp.]MBO9661815.1 cysteine hydrolase [Dokdonella sp.]
MSALQNRPRTALLVVDVQRDVVANAFRRDEVVAVVAGLVERARAAATPVIWVQHEDAELVPGSDGWRLVEALVPAAGEAIVRKRYRDAFDDTDLEPILADARVGRLFVTGAQSDFCIRSTLHGALARGYDAVLVADAHTTDDMPLGDASLSAAQIVAHMNRYWHGQTAPGRSGGAVRAVDVDFATA